MKVVTVLRLIHQTIKTHEDNELRRDPPSSLLSYACFIVITNKHMDLATCFVRFYEAVAIGHLSDDATRSCIPTRPLTYAQATCRHWPSAICLTFLRSYFAVNFKAATSVHPRGSCQQKLRVSRLLILITVFWNVTPCGLVGGRQHSGKRADCVFRGQISQVVPPPSV
jgi:hypothetical protein